jgi:hypothetical protein
MFVYATYGCSTLPRLIKNFIDLLSPAAKTGLETFGILDNITSKHKPTAFTEADRESYLRRAKNFSHTGANRQKRDLVNYGSILVSHLLTSTGEESAIRLERDAQFCPARNEKFDRSTLLSPQSFPGYITLPSSRKLAAHVSLRRNM